MNNIEISEKVSLDYRKCRSWRGMKTRKIESHLTSGHFCVKQEPIEIGNPVIEDGWEWFVLKKRSQRNRKSRLRRRKGLAENATWIQV